MRKQTSTKRALLLSALSLLMCVSMLIGSTFAWFTDSITSGQNQIIAGNLDVELYYTYDAAVAADVTSAAWEKVTATTDVFGYALWEPGYTKVAYFKVVNEGTLALNYRLSVDVYEENDGTNAAGETFLLSDYIKTALVDVGATRDQILAQTGTPLAGKFVMADSLTDPAHGTELEAGKSAVVGLAIWMPTSVNNAANHNGDAPSITFGVHLVATQKTVEKDSFDALYDAAAKYPLGKPASVSTTVDGIEAMIKIPEEAPEGDYEPKLSAITFDNTAGTTTMSFDLSLLHDGQKVENTGLSYPVTIKLPHPFVNMNGFKVLHNGQPVEGATYNEEDNTVSFVTNGFSPFAIVYTDYVDASFELAYQTDDAGNYTITKGMFVGKNPADIDTSLKDPDSAYIAVDFVKDGKTYYVVSERESSVFVAADNTTSYGAFNATNVDFRSNMNGKLWALFNKNEADNIYYCDHVTVFLLPGTFTEGTTINIGSSVDIIGLGDTAEVKIVKAANASSSNRHLLNCNGTKADYIQVTLRNMTLDATEKTSNNKDNAAVQSIRRTKVKCYDLTIIKGTALDAVAFYVNGNNEVDGVKPTAYLYAENCALNTTRTFGIISTAGTYKFYHSGITYNNGTLYTKNSGNNKNVIMAADDWTWD